MGDREAGGMEEKEEEEMGSVRIPPAACRVG